MKHRRQPGLYDPSTDGTLEAWWDPNDSSAASLLNTSGGAITNGATIGTVKSKKGTTRNFTQWGSNARPTWVTNAINGLSAMRFQSQIITTQTSVSVFNSIGAVTLMVVFKTNGVGSSVALSCNDPNTGFADITQWGVSGAVSLMNGWRVPRTDTFQTFTGGSVPGNGVYVSTSVWDFANAKASLFLNGTLQQRQAAFLSAGNTPASGAYALSLGGFAQQSGTAAAGLSSDGYIGEGLLWLSAKTPDQLVDAHTYLRRKWGGGLL